MTACHQGSTRHSFLVGALQQSLQETQSPESLSLAMRCWLRREGTRLTLGRCTSQPALNILHSTETNTSCNNSIGMASRVPCCKGHARLQVTSLKEDQSYSIQSLLSPNPDVVSQLEVIFYHRQCCLATTHLGWMPRYASQNPFELYGTHFLSCASVGS